jgi:hypothetical protein
VARRYVEGVVGAKLEPPAVLQLHGDSAGEDHAEVTRLAPLTTDLGANVDRPAPSWLRDQEADCQLAYFHKLGRELR